MFRRTGKLLFGNWWVPLALLGAFLAIQALLEQISKQGPNYNNDFPFVAAVILLLLLIFLLISVIYQLVHRRWVPASISLLAGVATVWYLLF